MAIVSVGTLFSKMLLTDKHIGEDRALNQTRGYFPDPTANLFVPLISCRSSMSFTNKGKQPQNYL